MLAKTGVPGENHRPPQITDKLFHVNVVSSTSRHQRDTNSQRLFLKALTA